MPGPASRKCNQNRLTACPDCVQAKIRLLEPGDTLQLLPGQYLKPITALGLRGAKGMNITIRGTTKPDRWWEKRKFQREADPRTDAVITSGIDAETFRPVANRAAARKQQAGGFPGLYYLADEACLFLRDCQHVVIENLFFQDCWPTALYLDNCQDITIQACQFRRGTYAIGATGHDTRQITVADCRWQQYPENNGGHWKAIPWHRIHGDIGNADDTQDKGIVNVEKDYRHLDGDFFVAWRIAGFVTLRRNLIEDAFNAIHLFNYEKGPRDELNRNVLIEKNRFERIRDNAVEPEFGAWNWVVRHNILMDVYRWFSFEMERSGWFYIYGNIAWNTQVPGPGESPPKNIEKDTRTGGSIFKLHPNHTADGPSYFFHNSFHLRERIVKRKRFAGLHFFNNAITYSGKTAGSGGPYETLFAKNFHALTTQFSPQDPQVDILAAERNRFTKDWTRLNIALHDNVIHGPDRFDTLRSLGYPFGANSQEGSPGFRGPFSPSSVSERSFHLTSGQKPGKAYNTSTPFTLTADGPQEISEGGGRHIGAYQANGKLFELSEEFGWLETADAGIV
ncbi:MAG: right-handed parallel beta-helix repeat-containing protein [Stappiaceae bacterium]